MDLGRAKMGVGGPEGEEEGEMRLGCNTREKNK